MNPSSHGRALASLGWGACLLAALAGCAAGKPQRPRYGLPATAAAPAAASSTSLAGVADPQSVTPATPAAAAEATELPGTGGTFVPGPQGVVFQPGQSPDEVDGNSQPTFSERLKLAWKRATGSMPSHERARELYREGERLFAGKQYSAASRRFKRAAKRWPDSELEEDSLYMHAESLFFADCYPGASDTYGRLMKEYENTRYLDTAVRRQFAIARYWEQLQRARPKWSLSPNLFDRTRPGFDTMGNAVAAYDSVRLNDPTGPLADDSLMATANLYFIDERFSDADHYYDIVRKDYPKSEYQIPAHVLGYQAKMRMYQGPLYDSSPLVEARDLGANTLLQFGSQLGEERSRIESAQRWIGDQLAEREWKMGQYYENTAHFGAAREYYAQVAEQYGDSRYGPMATARLQEIGGEPAAPAERLTWLANLFPGEKAASAARLANREPRRVAAENVAARPESESVTR